MCEGVDEDSSHGIRHVDIRVGVMNSLECVCLPLHCTSVGSNPCRLIPLLGFAHPVEGKLFQVQEVFKQTTLLRGRDYEASRTMVLIHVLCIY